MAKAKTIATQAHAAAQPERAAEDQLTVQPAPVQMATPLAKARPVKARVLSACAYGQPNDVIEIDAAQAASLSGVVDTDPAAVLCAESLKAGAEE